MSKCKLESLPNEILIDLLEKYVNGVDVLVAFGNHLNYLFDALVDQCRQYHFDFESIRKNDFEHCLRCLPTYCDRIQSLTLSERDTPNQIHFFLSIFPTFDQFKQLRQLRLNLDGNTVVYESVIKAIRSLLKTNLQTLSIEGKNAHILFSLNHLIQAIFTLPSVQRLFLAIDMNASRWNFPRLTPFHMKHLTIKGHGCTWNTFETILKCTSRLCYLNARVDDDPSYSHSSIIIKPLTKLKTLILDFIGNYDLTTFNMFLAYLRLMPRLCHLEIIDGRAQFVDAHAWQMCIQTSLLFVNYFSLTINNCFRQTNYVLLSFQTSFWIERKTFNIYVVTFEDISNDMSTSNSRYNRIHHLENGRRLQSILEILPQRCKNVTRFPLESLSNLDLSGKLSVLPTQYDFNNIEHLTVNHLNSFLFQWITTHIDLLHLTELRIPYLETMTYEIQLLLINAKNLSSLIIHFKQVFNEHFASRNVFDSIKRLDISLSKHPFRQEDIRFLTSVFPSTEHLKINMISLDNISLWNTYLPNLHSLTFKLIYPHYYEFIQQWNYRWRNQPQLLLKQTDEWLTLWIDQTTFRESYWTSPQLTHHQSNHGKSLKFYETKCVCS